MSYEHIWGMNRRYLCIVMLQVSITLDVSKICVNVLMCFCIWSTDYDDAAVRIMLIGYLTQVSTIGDGQSFIKSLVCDINQHLVTEHRKMLSKPRRCFANSQTHRQSHHLMTSLLIFDRFITVSIVPVIFSLYQ